MACPICDTPTGEQVRAGIFGAGFLSTLLTVLLPFPILLVAVLIINHALSDRPAVTAEKGRSVVFKHTAPMNAPTNLKPLVIAGTFLGIGLGGFVDGIVFHQLLQAHNMLSARFPKTTIPNMEINMFWDGLFHSMTWIMTVVGLALLWRAGARRDEVPWSGKAFVASLFLGWGLFNFVEGNHRSPHPPHSSRHRAPRTVGL